MGRRALKLRTWAAPLLLAAAVGEAVLWEGGFAATSRYVFGGLALAALVAAALADRDTARRLARHPVALTLWGLAALGAISAVWTIASAGDALRWGLVATSYGALVVSAGVLSRRRFGVQGLAAGICVLAAISGALGVVAVCVIGEPFADRIGGSWRPGGTLEYSSALALLQVSALPALLTAMCSARRSLAAAGVAGAAIAGAVLALADSRAELALAAAVLCLAVAIPRQTVRASRAQAFAAAVTVAAAALMADLIAGGRYAAGSSPGALRLAGIGMGCALIVLGWLTRRGLRGRRAQVAMAGATGIALAVVLSAGAAPAAAPAAATAPGRPAAAATAPGQLRAAHSTPAGGGLLHGRAQLWRAGLDAFADRPLAGSGADSFLLASARYQRGGPVRYAHDLPLELAVELGAAGILGALGLYFATGRAVWRVRGRRAAWLAAPGTVAFMAAGLIDWPWHLAGSGAVWAVCTGAVVGGALGARTGHAGVASAQRA